MPAFLALGAGVMEQIFLAALLGVKDREAGPLRDELPAKWAKRVSLCEINGISFLREAK